MSTQVDNSSNAIDSMQGLVDAGGSGTTYKAIMAVAASMDAVNASIGTYTSQVMLMMQLGQQLEQKMQKEQEATPSSPSEYAALNNQMGQNTLATQLISNGVQGAAASISQSSNELSAWKSVGDAITKMYDQTSRV